MVMEGGIIDDHEVIPEIQEARDNILAWASAFVEAARLVKGKEYGAASAEIEDSSIPQEVKARLMSALETDEYDLIDGVFADVTSKLGAAFCEGCGL